MPTNLQIETLNQWGGGFLGFAWPMLWQSSLLIALIFALDWVLARKARAAVRYALWLVVLLKLVLPPTLAVPTSAGWWLFRQPAVTVPVAKFAVTYGDAAPTTQSVVHSFAPVVKPELDAAAYAFLASMAISVALFIWLLVRWQQMHRKIRQSPTTVEFDAVLESALRASGLHSRVTVKIVDGYLSPAVCGLFHPVILLPRILIDKLSAGQLRAVLLHELIHHQRKDVWVNCAQTFMQIFYWWHPLLWLANARIRCVREEAVDDAVMLALSDEPDLYAPTLLEVAKLAFYRPRLSVGSVGIMESRSALRQRIERLVNFRAPRRAGLTIISILGILAFIAVAVPMGGAPAPEPNWAPAANQPIQPLNPAGPQVHIKARFIEGPVGSLNFGTNDPENVSWVMDDEYARKILKKLESTPGVKILAEPEVLTISARRTRMMSVQNESILTNYALIEIPNKPCVMPQVGVFKIGPVVDVVPHVYSDGHSISLQTKASLTEFLGYGQTNPVAVYTKAGTKIELPQVRYELCMREASGDLDLSDNQTVLLRLDKHFFSNGTEIDSEPDAKKAALEDKDVLVFITVTLVDAAGNRIHPNDRFYYKYPTPDPILVPGVGGRSLP